MSRKLRFEVGDYVLFTNRLTKETSIGIITNATKFPIEQWKEYGIYRYSISWDREEMDISNTDWSILDFTKGTIKYIGNNEKALKVLYEFDRR